MAKDEESVAENDSGKTMISLPLLAMIRDLQQKHGLRHNDYQRYRGYCARRILRVRKALGLVQGEKKKFTKKDVTLDMVAKDGKYLQIPLMTAERAWAYSVQLKFELNTEPRKKYHMINRLRKAKFYAEMLDELTMSSDRCDARSKLETQAYSAWISGTLFFETQDWKESMKAFTAARTIYEKLSLTLGEEEGQIYRQRMDEIVPSLRYCAYNIGDASAKQDLMNLRGHGIDLDELINQTREQQASTLQEVEWRGRKMGVKQEKVRMFLLREQEFKDELASASSSEEVVSVYESLMLDCKDAIQVLRDDLVEDPNFRNRQQVKEGPVSANHFLYTYLTFIKYTKVIERNLVMIDSMKAILEGKVKQPEGKKPVKPQDLVRLYENIVSNLNELPNLAGLEEDLAFKQEIEAKVRFYKGVRCYYIAQSFLAAKKWPESMALFQRSFSYAQKAKDDPSLNDDLRKQAEEIIKAIEGRQFVAHANSILDNESVVDKMETLSLDKSAPLIDRLDQYYEDPELIQGKAALARFPPAFKPIPCKPLFFDLALEHLTFPSLDSKLAAPSGQQGQGGQSGWLGGWLGGWGGGNKK